MRKEMMRYQLSSPHRSPPPAPSLVYEEESDDEEPAEALEYEAEEEQVPPAEAREEYIDEDREETYPKCTDYGLRHGLPAKAQEKYEDYYGPPEGAREQYHAEVPRPSGYDYN